MLKAVKCSIRVRDLAKAMSCQGNTAEVVWKAGIQLLCHLYGGKETDTLTTLRHARYMAMIAPCATLEPQWLPPTERAAHFHSLRVHLQVVRWQHLDNTSLNECEWGWKLEDGCMVPIMTDLDAAPTDVLKFIRCKCKASGRNHCTNNLCSCRKNGLKCVMACGGCRGQSCDNGEDWTLEDQIL